MDVGFRERTTSSGWFGTPATAPYDSDYYLEKLDDWLERYGPYLGVKPMPAQGELF